MRNGRTIVPGEVIMTGVDIDLEKTLAVTPQLISGIREAKRLVDEPSFEIGRVARLIAGGRELVDEVIEFPVCTDRTDTGISRQSISMTLDELTPLLGRLMVLLRRRESPEDDLKEQVRRVYVTTAITLNQLLATSTIKSALGEKTR